MRDDDSEQYATFPGPPDLPDEHGQDAPEDSEGPSGHSLTDDLIALLDDGKTYAEAELAFQRSRAAFTADRLKGAIGFGLAAFGVLHLALIGLTVGVVLALIPIVGPWAATGIVTVTLVIVGLFFLRLLKSRFDEIRGAFSEDGNELE